MYTKAFEHAMHPTAIQPAFVQQLAQEEIICLAANSPPPVLQGLLEQLAYAENLPLKMLCLSGNPLKPSDLALICTIVARSKQLVYLDLSHCELGTKHTAIMASLGTVIEKHPTLLSLIFSNNWLTEKDQLYLANTLLNGHILQLDLAFNQALDQKTCEVFGNYLSEESCNVISLNVTPDNKRMPGCLTAQQRIACELKGNQQKLHDEKYVPSLSQIEIPSCVLPYLKDRIALKTVTCHEKTALELYSLVALKKHQACTRVNRVVSAPGLLQQYSTYQSEAFHATQPGSLETIPEAEKPEGRIKTIST